MRIVRTAAAVLFAASFACTGPADDATLSQDTSALRPEGAGLTATLSAAKTTFGAADPVTVTLTIQNTGHGALRLLRWLGPSTDLQEKLFAVSRDGAAVRYIGPDYKRTAPEADDFLTIAPGHSVSAEVTLSGAYDLSATGAYSVRYAVGSLESNPLTLWVEGRETVQPAAQPGDVTTLGAVSYTKCDASQQSLILQAITQATTYANGSLSYLQSTNPSGTPRYTTWFGAFASSGWSKATNDYSLILDAFQTKNLSFDCGCKQKSVYAFVYSNRPYEIHLCPVFWQVPVSGTDSKGGTLVHEMSHFTVTAGTNDWAYGQSACRSLAISNPTQALGNADSHEYFAENNPALQ
ncbi:MAG TPA: M35 family metallo-endopeptidase [Myxococcaceae bacterium]|nr:M35 family metallo-endopeptidase [Myxococcaceae bacterium]